MVPAGVFTTTDLLTVCRAGLLAERLTGDYFGMASDEWKRHPYGIFTRKEIDDSLLIVDTFAQVVFCRRPRFREANQKDQGHFGIVLQDPFILQALLRSSLPDLWTLALFIMTHELVHIVRFRKYGIDFSAEVAARDKEENLVHGITQEILSGVDNMNQIFKLYETHAGFPRTDAIYS
jgi:hypothetical protein